MNKSYAWAIAILAVSANYGCGKAPSEKAADARRSNLGVSPANWPQEGPAPIGPMVPISMNDDVTGAVHRIIVDPANSATIYAASVNGGVWKTTNADSVFGPGGSPPTRPHWDTHTDSFPSLTIGAMAIDPLNPQHLVAGTGERSNGLPPGAEGLVYVSTAGANSWGAPIDHPLLRGKRIRGIAVRGQIILAATVDPNQDSHGALLRSPDGGASWQSLGGTGGLPASIGSGFDVIVDPSSSDRFYALIADRGWGGSGLYLGTSGGTVWTRVSDNDSSSGGLAAILRAPGLNNGRLAVGPTGALAVALSALGRLAYVASSIDQGQNWTAMDLPSAPLDASPSGPPATKTNIATITRGSVPGGQNTTILVDAGVPHHLNGDSCRVRILDVSLPASVNPVNGEWIAVPYNDPATGGTPSTTKFILQSRLVPGGDGDGTTTPFNASGQGTWQCWQGPNGGGQGDPNLAIAVDPTNPKIVYVGGDASAIYLVRGDMNQPTSTAIPSAQWASLTGGTSGQVHVDIRDLTLDPSGQLLFMASDGGVFVRTNPRDASGLWSSLAGDLMSVEFRSIALDPLSHAIVGGTQDNGTPTELQSSTGTPVPWTQIEFADGVAVAAVNGHTTDPGSGKPVSYRYTSFQGSNDFELHTFDDTGAKISTQFLIDPNSATNSKLVVSTTPVVKHLNDVENFDWLSAIGVNRQFNPLASPQPNPQKWLLIAGHNQGVWESRDLGQTIALIAGSPTNARDFSYGHASNVEALWVTAENGGQTTLYSRLAAGDPLAPETSWSTFGNGAAAVVMSAGDPEIVYATAESRVYKVTHGGSVVDVTGDLALLSNGPFQGPGRLRSIVYVPSATNGDRVIVAASDGGVPGVFMMAVDNPGVWTRLGTNLPNANAMALDYDPVNQMLVVGTGGRGAWSLTGVTSLDRAPMALCKNMSVSADATCRANPAASDFNNGSTDPEGNPLTFTAIDPTTLLPKSIGPVSLGSYPVTIKATDSLGAAALCSPTLTVNDTTPPSLQVPPAKSVQTCADGLVVSVGQATATDTCAGSLVPTGQVITKNGVNLNPPIPVVNGQVTLSPGTYTVQWSVSDGANPPVRATQNVTVAAGIEVGQTFLLDDRAQLRSSGGGFAALLNSGTGTTRVGQDCRLAGVASRAAVTVLHRAVVAGNVVSGSTVTKDSDATITGTTTQNASVVLPALPSLPSFPPPTLGGFTVNPGPTQSKAPGSYSAASVVNGGTLILSAGDYYFQSFTINSGAIVRVAPTTRLFVRDSLQFNAPFLATTGSAVQPIFMGFAGTTLNLFALFNGTLVAPNASVVFGTGAGLTFTGSFFGRSFEVTPGSSLVCSL